MITVCVPLPGNGQYQTQWDYVLSNFKPDVLYVVGDEADAPPTNVFARLSATYITDLSSLPPKPLIVMAADNGKYVAGDENLSTFTHPVDATYFFGNDSLFLDESMFGGRTPDHFVFIDTDSTDDMWSWVAYAVVVWDRMSKRG